MRRSGRLPAKARICGFPEGIRWAALATSIPTPSSRIISDRQSIRDGRAGLILPNGLVTGFTYRDFLRHLLSTKTLASFYGFENEDKLFKSVHNETKFGLLDGYGLVAIPSSSLGSPRTSVSRSRSSDPERRYALTIDEIEAINPNTLNLPAFRWAKDAEVTATIHKAAPVLVRKHPDGRVENPWQVKLKTLFHMAGASGDFLDHQDIAPLIAERRGALAVLEDGRQVYPLYEGKMFWHFDHRYGTYEGQTEKQANKGVLPRVSDAKHDDPGYRIEPRYWVDARLTDRSAWRGMHDANGFSLGETLALRNEHFIGTIIPKTAAGDKSPILFVPAKQPNRIAALVALSE